MDFERKRLTIASWSLRLDILERLGESWRAVIGLAPLAHLHIRPLDAGYHVELWTTPTDGDGPCPGVLVDDNGVVAITIIPICGCGSYGCSATGKHFSGRVTRDRLPRLVELLRNQPMVQFSSQGDETFWQLGDWQDALSFGEGQ